jgi:hypothetical protein
VFDKIAAAVPASTKNPAASVRRRIVDLARMTILLLGREWRNGAPDARRAWLTPEAGERMYGE